MYFCCEECGASISTYLFVDERHLLWHSLVISAADHESISVIDGLMQNDVVKSDIHSPDTHGYTEAFFGLTHLLGFSFAPRIKGIGKLTRYGFGSPRMADRAWTLSPDKAVNDKLICAHWDEFLRLVVTIKLKENTAAAIFRRLNSYSRQHALYQTIKAFGQIIKTLFILRYADSLELRQTIEAQLNKVELANRFARAVAEGCTRLIRNCIICWNYLYLTRRLETITDGTRRDQLRRTIAAASPMSWPHINLPGEYDFSDDKLQDSLGIPPLKSAPSCGTLRTFVGIYPQLRAIPTTGREWWLPRQSSRPWPESGVSPAALRLRGNPQYQSAFRTWLRRGPLSTSRSPPSPCSCVPPALSVHLPVEQSARRVGEVSVHLPFPNVNPGSAKGQPPGGS